MKIYNSVNDLIGNTPLLHVTKFEKNYNAEAQILAKLESFNPAGSSKDRVAKKMLDDAEKNGLLTPNSVIIEPTSGNTGIGLAAIASSRGYKVILTMPESMSIERRNLLKAYGAEIVLTKSADGMNGAIKKSEELSKSIPNSFLPGQFTNPSNPLAHFESTGPEIWEDTEGKVDIFIAGIGTGGTLSGTGKYLKSKNSNIKIVGFEPSASPFITKGVAGSHTLQGIGAGFIPDTLDTSVYDEILTIEGNDAFNACKIMARDEGILVGITSGAALYAATILANRPENQGKVIVALLPDTGDRYLSSGVFD